MWNEFMMENDTVLYNLTLELKETYENQGFMNSLNHFDVADILKNSLYVREIDSDCDDDDCWDDNESEDYE